MAACCMRLHTVLQNLHLRQQQPCPHTFVLEKLEPPLEAVLGSAQSKME